CDLLETLLRASGRLVILLGRLVLGRRRLVVVGDELGGQFFLLLLNFLLLFLLEIGLALAASLAAGSTAHHPGHATGALPPSSTSRLFLGDILLLGFGLPVPVFIQVIDKCAPASRVRIKISKGDEHGSVADQPRAGLGGHPLAFRLVIV